MVTVDTISMLKTSTLQAVISKESDLFGDKSFATVERDFVDYINGPGAYDDFANWREAWRAFVEFCSEDEDEQDDETSGMETVIGYVTTGVPGAVLTAQNQMTLF